ncbi:MAG TPA: hypothetical protein VF549_10460 [Solirubrobacteraceae bacterium]|jgi:hypothetical protein
MSAARIGLAVAGAALATSLFLPFYADVSGWEHWAWADVVLAVLAVDLVAGALLLRRPVAAHSAILGVLCALGIAVVLGHGFAPDARTDGVVRVAAGPYVALAALGLGFIAAAWPWPRVGVPVLLAAGAGGLVASLFATWGTNPAFGSAVEPNGWERWHALDVAFVALALALLGTASGRAPTWLAVACGAGAILAGACVVAAGFDQTGIWIDEGVAEGAPAGALAAGLALAGALAGLTLLATPREPAERAG